MSKYFTSNLQSLKAANVDDYIDLKKVYSDLIKEYKPATVEDSILVQHLAILYVRLGRSWAAELDLLNKTLNTFNMDPFQEEPVTDYGAGKLELILTRYEPSILKSIAKVKVLLSKRQNNWSKILKKHNVAEGSDENV